MSLLPIVYTSLVIFFGFLLIVITISYLTFKTKSKVNPLIEEEVKKHERRLVVVRQNQFFSQPSNMNGQNITDVRIAYAYQNNNLLGNKAQIVPSNYFQTINNESELLQHTSRNKNTTELDRKDTLSTTNLNLPNRERRPGNRIEIMNDSSKFQKNKSLLNNKDERNIQHSFVEYNMFNFYSDIPENGLSSITAVPNRAV